MRGLPIPKRDIAIAVFFTADTRFGDHRVLNISKRPFGSVGEMDAVMITRWNSVVGAEDDVWHLDRAKDFLEYPLIHC
jgi:calcineurin-like phosphoesterase family protein